MPSVSCSVVGCIKDVHRKTYCHSHYMKNWRYGTPTPQHAPRGADLSGQRFGSLIAVSKVDRATWSCQCDCGRSTLALVGDLNRGTKISCGDRRVHRRSTDAGYAAAHDRVKRDRGSAKEQACIHCGNQARHWSYNHDDSNEVLAYGLSANPVAYSLDPSRYSPRCVSCHKKFDLGRNTSMTL